MGMSSVNVKNICTLMGGLVLGGKRGLQVSVTTVRPFRGPSGVRCLGGLKYIICCVKCGGGGVLGRLCYVGGLCGLLGRRRCSYMRVRTSMTGGLLIPKVTYGVTEIGGVVLRSRTSDMSKGGH